MTKPTEYHHGTVHKSTGKRFGIGRWLYAKNKDGQYQKISEGQFNKMGFRHGKNREVFETGFVYDGLWEDGMVEVN